MGSPGKITASQPPTPADIERILDVKLPREATVSLGLGGGIVTEGKDSKGGREVVIINGHHEEDRVGAIEERGAVYRSSFCGPNPPTLKELYQTHPASRPTTLDVVMRSTCRDFNFSLEGTVSPTKLERARALLLQQGGQIKSTSRK